MKIAVCEDNAEDRMLICGYIHDYMTRHSYEAEIIPFTNGEALLKAFPSESFQLLFLDIYLPGISGIETAKKIREMDQHCKLMFITTSPDFMAESFTVQTSDYVIKPIKRENMDRTMTVFYDALERSSRKIEVPIGRGGNVGIALSKIEYIEAFGKLTVFSMHESVVETQLTISEVEDMLGGEPFLRCHRSYIVNMNHVKDIYDDSFQMKNGASVPLPIRNRRELKLTVTGFLAGRSLSEIAAK